MKTKRDEIQFADLLRRAVEEPGIIGKAYSAFHNYSIGNQLAAWSQCVTRGIPLGPIATYNGWKIHNRHVTKEQKAIVLCQPVTCSRTERDGATGEERKSTFTRFAWRASWFVLSQTEGETFENIAPLPSWDADKALATLGISRVPFALADGNCQGYATGRVVSVSPVAAFPHKTLFHELAHVMLGHTAERMTDDDATPRDIREVEAEAVAFLMTASLELDGMAEARGYIQHWGNREPIGEDSARRIMAAANRILSAGRGEV